MYVASGARIGIASKIGGDELNIRRIVCTGIYESQLEIYSYRQATVHTYESD